MERLENILIIFKIRMKIVKEGSHYNQYCKNKEMGLKTLNKVEEMISTLNLIKEGCFRASMKKWDMQQFLKENFSELLKILKSDLIKLRSLEGIILWLLPQ